MNKITQEHIDNLIEKSKVESIKIGLKTTVVHVTLPNGFEVVESAACVAPENYVHSIGEQIALDRVKDRVWLLEGYLLQNRLGESND